MIVMPYALQDCNNYHENVEAAIQHLNALFVIYVAYLCDF